MSDNELQRAKMQIFSDGSVKWKDTWTSATTHINLHVHAIAGHDTIAKPSNAIQLVFALDPHDPRAFERICRNPVSSF